MQCVKKITIIINALMKNIFKRITNFINLSEETPEKNQKSIQNRYDLLKITKIKDGMYRLNDDVIISNFDFDTTTKKVVYDLKYDENNITEENATHLADLFVGNVIFH